MVEQDVRFNRFLSVLGHLSRIVVKATTQTHEVLHAASRLADRPGPSRGRAGRARCTPGQPALPLPWPRPARPTSRRRVRGRRAEAHPGSGGSAEVLHLPAKPVITRHPADQRCAGLVGHHPQRHALPGQVVLRPVGLLAQRRALFRVAAHDGTLPEPRADDRRRPRPDDDGAPLRQPGLHARPGREPTRLGFLSQWQVVWPAIPLPRAGRARPARHLQRDARRPAELGRPGCRRSPRTSPPAVSTSSSCRRRRERRRLTSPNG